jgi:hypothetical protein
MNIFILSKNIKRCARYHANAHVVKMILETAQILCSAHVVLDNILIINEVPLYKLTHKNHPCNIWVRTSSENYIWLYKLFCELCKEYTFRYKKVHLCEKKLKEVLSNIPKNITRGDLTNFALAMPDECKIDNDAIKSYRKYYNTRKTHIGKWKDRKIPHWYNPIENN